MDKVAVFVYLHNSELGKAGTAVFLMVSEALSSLTGLSLQTKLLLFSPKLVYIICKCNQTMWLRISRCRSGKQPSWKIGLLRIISPSTALLRDPKWALVLPWQCWRWLKYEAELIFFRLFAPSAAGRRVPSNKQARSCNLCSRFVWFLQPHPGSSLDFMIICAGRFTNFTVYYTKETSHMKVHVMIKGSSDWSR